MGSIKRCRQDLAAGGRRALPPADRLSQQFADSTLNRQNAFETPRPAILWKPRPRLPAAPRRCKILRRSFVCFIHIATTIIKLMAKNSFGAAAKLRVGATEYGYYRLASLEEKGVGNIARLPFSIRILLENLLRSEDGRRVSTTDVEYVACGASGEAREISFMPARVLLQDFTGVPCVVDLAAMRDALSEMGADPARANPLMPADLVIDHSVQVDSFGSGTAFDVNALLEFQRNRERYMLLRWGQTAFRNFRVVPPDTGIVHQINLEYLAPVVFRNNGEAYPDTLVGTD